MPRSPSSPAAGTAEAWAPGKRPRGCLCWPAGSGPGLRLRRHRLPGFCSRGWASPPQLSTSKPRPSLRPHACALLREALLESQQEGASSPPSLIAGTADPGRGHPVCSWPWSPVTCSSSHCPFLPASATGAHRECLSSPPESWGACCSWASRGASHGRSPHRTRYPNYSLH